MNSIFSKLLYLMEKNVDIMLVTTVWEDGSAPRGTGSQMLVETRGRVIGTIGGGPAEKHATETAMQLLAEQQSGFHEYRLHQNSTEDIGSVCGGNIRLLFQYIPASDSAWKELAGKLLEQIGAHKKGWLVQRLDGGMPALLGAEGEVLAGQLTTKYAEFLGNGCILTESHFSMLLPIGERAVIFGAGHCAQALVPVLKSVGFRVTVYDDRPDYANHAVIPGADEIICSEYTGVVEKLSLNEQDYVVVMTSGHTHDFEIQEQVLRTSLAYVGVIGSRKKTTFVNARLRECGVEEDAIRRVHTPIGVSIKAVTPEEIAISIAGEMILIRAEYREAAGKLTKACPMH